MIEKYPEKTSLTIYKAEVQIQRIEYRGQDQKESNRDQSHKAILPSLLVISNSVNQKTETRKSERADFEGS